VNKNDGNTQELVTDGVISGEQICHECLSGNMQLQEVQDDWRKRKSYYERLQFGPGVRTCIGRNGVCCKNMVHLEIARCGVAYLC
jgi:hypothetical protein